VGNTPHPPNESTKVKLWQTPPNDAKQLNQIFFEEIH